MINRSSLLSAFRQLLHAARGARKTGASLQDAFSQQRPGRRQVLKGMGAAAVSLTALRSGAVRAAASPRIAIVGGGISGLNAALTLHDAGLRSIVYEASRVVGGRMHSNRNWLEGQTSEWCGEFIDSGHTALMQLASRFNLTLIDMIGAQPSGSTDTLWFFEKYYGVAQAYQDFQAIATQLEADANGLYPTTFDPATQSARAKYLDSISVYQWIEQYVPGGHRAPLGAYLDSAYTNEFGLDTDVQSALNIIYSLGFQPDPTQLSIYGFSDQRFHVLGGNDQIPRAIAAALPDDTVKTGWWMESIRKNADGTFALTFATGDGVRSVTADHVILTLPFSVLRGLDYAKAGFDALKVNAIRRLGYGTNSKLNVQTTRRLWDGRGPWGIGDGNIYTDLHFQNSWDASRGIPGASGVLVGYNGGSAGSSMGGASSPWATADDPTVARYVRQFLGQANEPWPGIDNLWNGRATLSTPWRAPNLLGSYACWKVGQYTTITGSEGLRQGNCHFAGEHTSLGFQGFMEGGAEEGARAAEEIISG